MSVIASEIKRNIKDVDFHVTFFSLPKEVKLLTKKEQLLQIEELIENIKKEGVWDD